MSVGPLQVVISAHLAGFLEKFQQIGELFQELGIVLRVALTKPSGDRVLGLRHCGEDMAWVHEDDAFVCWACQHVETAEWVLRKWGALTS